MKILVMGGSGYVGSILIPLLRKKNTVRNFDVQHLVKFMFNPERADDFLKSKDIIIYLASMSNNDACEKYPAVAKLANQDNFVVIMKAAKNEGVKHVIYASSVAAYGSGENFIEDDPLNPTTIYGQGKKFCEEYLETQDVPYTIVRAATVCGWSPKMRWDTTVNKMVHDGLKGTITLNGGEQKRCHVNIKDLCDFYELILDKPQNETYNVVGLNQQLNHTAYTVAALTHSRIIVKERTDDRSYTISGQKAWRVLGWLPLHSIGDAVADIFAHV